jgi:hypothetical protein
MGQRLLWNPEKEEWLKSTRNLSFTMVEEALGRNVPIMDIQHPKAERSHQRMLIFKVGSRACVVPYVTDGETKFLKTMYYDRDWTRSLGEDHG